MKILFIYDVGASSGFMARSMREAAKRRGIEAEIIARSDTKMLSSIQGVGILTMEPYLEYSADSIREEVSPYDVPAIFINREAYGSIDGDAILIWAIEYVKQQGETVSKLNTIQKPEGVAKTARTKKPNHTAEAESGKDENAFFRWMNQSFIPKLNKICGNQYVYSLHISPSPRDS